MKCPKCKSKNVLYNGTVRVYVGNVVGNVVPKNVPAYVCKECGNKWH